MCGPLTRGKAVTLVDQQLNILTVARPVKVATELSQGLRDPKVARRHHAVNQLEDHWFRGTRSCQTWWPPLGAY